MSAKIATALHNVMSKVSYVQKTGKNAFHGYRYAGEADLLEKLRPAMIEEGLLLIPSVKSVRPVDEHGNTTVEMEYTLAHKDGDVWPEKIGAVGTGNDRNKNGVGDKGTYKAITGANKYLLFKLFQIETGDDPEITEPAPERPFNGHVKISGPSYDPPPPPDPDVMAYLVQARSDLANCDNSEDVMRWWKSTAPTRKALGIDKGSPAFAQVVKLCEARDAEIAAEVGATLRAG